MSIVETAFKDAMAMRTDGYRYFRVPFNQAVIDELKTWSSRDQIALNGVQVKGNTIEIGICLSFMHVVKPELAELATNLTRIIPYSNADRPVWHPVAQV